MMDLSADEMLELYKTMTHLAPVRRECTIERDDGITVTIGDENEDSNLKDCSLITASYSVDGKLVGKIGVIGPTRMKYSKITSIIEYLTENLTDTFKLESGESTDNDKGENEGVNEDE